SDDVVDVTIGQRPADDTGSAPRKLDLKVGRQTTVRMRRPKLVVRLLLVDVSLRPCAGERWTLEHDEGRLEGEVDELGLVEVELPLTTREARVTLAPEGEAVRWDLTLEVLEAIETVKGVQARLNHLGFPCGEVDGQESGATRSGVQAFERRHGLEPT